VIQHRITRRVPKEDLTEKDMLTSNAQQLSIIWSFMAWYAN
jgi:hypothetical protein